MIDFDGGDSALAVLGALLDRSLTQIGEASADARRFDRELIRSTADVWDSNSLPFFRAATADTPSEREHRALAALEWMAGLGEERRAWVLGQAAAAGHPVDGLLPPAKPSLPGRDYQGRVMAPVMAMTPRTAQSLAADYDLPSAEVRSLHVERAGSRLTGCLELAVSRSYPVDDETSPDDSPESATLAIRLRDITEVRFDSRDARGVAFRPDAEGTSIGIGARGALRAATADVSPDDRCWHLSSAGRRADATTPPRESRPAPAGPPREGDLGDYAMAAATLLHHAMLEIRTVRYHQHAHQAPVRVLQRVFAGAGQAVLAAGGHRPHLRREAAFRRLIETWARRGGPALTEWIAEVLDVTCRQPDFVADLREQARAARAVGAPRRSAPTPWALPGPPESELRLAMYTAAHTRCGTHHDSSALVHLAVPPHPEDAAGTPWRLRSARSTGLARFQLRTEAFQGAGHARVTVDDDALRHVLLRDGALHITSGEDGDHDPS
ncbi:MULTISPECIES: hypothetical protein [Streptomyces]|uniref:Uncharacterized protein n=1 Tax=Streptomyces griseocarneus TaxID=51201 RepID=A0ABX7RKQ5_9ACTN|nr:MULTISPECIES: hypothetical protein [Streptomyces]QSY48846.1 hypothetical protein J3S04_28115 [Streptomyces griseocarneus]